MKRKNLLGNCLIILLMMCSTLPVHAAVVRVRIMSFNIPYGNVNTPTNTWEMRAEHLHAYIRQVSPDLIGMQEPVRNELVSILSGTPGYAMVGCGRDDGAEKGEYTPIIYKTDRFYVQQYGNYWLTDTPDVVSRVPGSTHNRIATWALMIDKESGAKFLYTNTHLSYETEPVRLEQIRVLKAHMKELDTRYGGEVPHLLTGDFNMKRAEDNYNYVKNYLLTMKDMWMNTRRKLNQTGNTDDQCIDYIYGSRNVYCTYAEWNNKVTEDGCTMSDHHPLWADVYWNTTSEDNARAAIQEAWALIDSTYEYQQNRMKLITNVSQLTTDGAESSNPLSTLLDGSTATFFHSLYSTMPPNQPHYIQVMLNRDITDCRFQYNRRYDNTYGICDRWRDILVTASNDGNTWDYITGIQNFGDDPARTYTSSNISLHRPYKYIRFSILCTPGMKLRNGSPQFSASEFQLFQNTHSPISQRFVDEKVGATADALEVMITETQQSMAAGTISKTDVDRLLGAIADLRQARTDAATAIRLVTSVPTPADSPAYTLSGQSTHPVSSGIQIRKDPQGRYYKVLISD